MARAQIVLDAQGRFAGVSFECPAGHEHLLPVDWAPPGLQRSPAMEGRATWSFNGDLERPTFSPSIAARSGHHAGQSRATCWCTYNAANPREDGPQFTCFVCHSYVRDGRIQFLGDCTHALAGQTVDLTELVDT